VKTVTRILSFVVIILIIIFGLVFVIENMESEGKIDRDSVDRIRNMIVAGEDADVTLKHVVVQIPFFGDWLKSRPLTATVLQITLGAFALGVALTILYFVGHLMSLHWRIRDLKKKNRQYENELIALRTIPVEGETEIPADPSPIDEDETP